MTAGAPTKFGKNFFKGLGDVALQMGMIGTFGGFGGHVSNMDDRPKINRPCHWRWLINYLVWGHVSNLICLGYLQLKLGNRSEEEKTESKP